MKTLTNTQKQKLSTGNYSRNGITIPGSDKDPLKKAACWNWAIFGEYVNVNDEQGADYIYKNLFTYNNNRSLKGLNADYINTLKTIYPDTEDQLDILTDNFKDAVGNDTTAQGECRKALIKITAIVNGYDVLGDGDDHNYVLHMVSSSWYGWDHWGISVKTANTRNYIQTVTDVPVSYKCNCMWDEHLTEVAIGIDGLQQAHLDTIDNIPDRESGKCTIL